MANLPTLRDVRDRLTKLIDRNLGHLEAQLLIVPDATLDAINMSMGPGNDLRPTLMINLTSDDGNGPPFGLISKRAIRG